MKLFNSSRKNLYTLAIIVIIVIMIVFFLNTKNEGFTSGFRQMYRPHIRNARLTVEEHYNKTKNYFTIMLKKFGII
jgi:predicted PurR-regulated permease PerM